MTLKRFTTYRIGVAAALAAIISVSITNGNYLLPIAAIAAALVILFSLRQRVEDVIADERDYELGGRSARYSLTIFSIFMVAVSFVLMALGQHNPLMYQLGSLASYLACSVLILNGLVFRFLRIKQEGLNGANFIRRGLPFFFLAFAVAAIFTAAAYSLFR